MRYSQISKIGEPILNSHMVKQIFCEIYPLMPAIILERNAYRRLLCYIAIIKNWIIIQIHLVGNFYQVEIDTVDSILANPYNNFPANLHKDPGSIARANINYTTLYTTNSAYIEPHMDDKYKKK